MSTTYNALKSGAFAQMTVLPWEKQEEFDALHEALRQEYLPNGPSEEAIIFDIADVYWRKQRLRCGFYHAANRATQEVREAKSAGGMLAAFSEALDLVRARGAAKQPSEAPEGPPQQALERAYDPDFMMKYARVEATLDSRLTKLYQRYATIKVLKKFHQLESEKAVPQLPAPSTEPDSPQPSGWSPEVLNRANRRR